jgi:hypothetical protein
MKFDAWQCNPAMIAHLNALFDARFPACCGCEFELQGDEVQFEFSDGQPGKFPLCLTCIEAVLVGEGHDCHADPVKMPALLARAERRAVELILHSDGEEARAAQ